MTKKLVIVESPSKAKTIKKYLPKGYNVQATKGHLIDLPKSRIGIDIEDNFEPEYIKVRGKAPIINQLKKEAAKADEVLLATDPDREGEAISWHVANFLNLDPASDCRIEFHEITKHAVNEALENKHPVDMNLVNSQQARRALDRIVGYSISPFLWKKVRRGLSAGRVQSVVTRIIIDREEEIKAFKPEEYWTIDVDLRADDDKQTFNAVLKTEKGKNVHIPNETEATRLEEKIKRNPLSVKSIKTRKRKQNPPLPFTTSTMQQQAYNKLGMSSARTMRAAQELFEGVNIKGLGQTGLITYLRTDSTRLAPEAIESSHAYITENYGENYVIQKAKAAKKGKNVQDAHEAIRPADITLRPDEIKDSLSSDQYRLYKLIWERMLASQMQPAEFQVHEVDIACDDLVLRAKGEKLIFDGFTAVTGLNKKTVLLPKIEEDSTITLEKLNKEQKFTNPPPRYTEATLIKQLEENGIGRPSTYAPTISTIKNRGYVEVEDKKLVPTELGYIVNTLMKENFEDIVDIGFTALMEEDLDKIAEGGKDWKGLLSEFYSGFKVELDQATENVEKIEIQEPETDEICELCGSKMIIKNGRFGKFLACPNFPDCKFTKPFVEKTGGICPECGGDLVKKKSKKGRTFYGCMNYPNCEFSTWDLPISAKCPECGKTLYQKGLGKRRKFYCIDHGEINEQIIEQELKEE